MKFSAEIKAMPCPELPDLQGKAVLPGLEHPGPDQVNDVRIGKHFALQQETEHEEKASCLPT